MSFRIAPFLRQRLFTTSTRARTAIPMESVTASQFASTANVVPKLGRIAKWYLPSMAAIAIGFGVTNALHEVNRKAHMVLELTQEEKNQQLMNLYGERSSLEDMERAFAGLETTPVNAKDRAKLLEEAYGDRASIKDLEKAMELYEVQ
ncbi:hypothetical protein P153DRAFT_298123 [Dothidotthia symphoricarpi CBS 119687]|uniref:Uncharacterized protein n=1 Tax=Dothidotthia symphoricarpi CBS 119687 TaxID=1392245 RepID=A0A6A6A3L7_9PLEO|nr:uncharacterized protein P153DRAFT_298123 [Dothidotthia symphoricarpi CBS 119687]KAF2126146.1 hypothetical protein P153DRAFT_298123 [Dothidotthia symphoricarpi CBS 119687]